MLALGQKSANSLSVIFIVPHCGFMTITSLSILTILSRATIGVIKVVRAATGLGLKEAKDLVDGVPSKVKEALDSNDVAHRVWVKTTDFREDFFILVPILGALGTF